jgi:hypothetical protein
MNKFISTVTAFKHFQGNYDRIQKSAMYSWKANDLQVVVPNNEVDTKGSCAGFSNITVIEGVKRGRELGFATQAPILKDLIDKALPVIDTPMVAFLNADIVLLEDFTEKVEKIFEKYGYDVFITGSRSDIQANYYVNNEETYKKIQSEPRTPFPGSDIFITSKFIWRQFISGMPEFIMGRYCLSDWLCLQAQVKKLKKYNCTNFIPTLHPVHGDEHIYQQEKAHGVKSPSSQHNMNLWISVMEKYGSVSIKNWPEIE